MFVGKYSNRTIMLIKLLWGVIQFWLRNPTISIQSAWRIYFDKNVIKPYYHILLNWWAIPTKAKIWHLANCIEFGQVLLTIVDRFIMLPRSRSHTPTYTRYSYIGSTQKHASIHQKFCSYTGSREKNVCRRILHILKDSDLSLGMWFRRRNMGYVKSLKMYIYGHMKVQEKKIWTHEGPCKEKNDEHMKAHVLKKKKKIAMLQKQ